MPSDPGAGIQITALIVFQSPVQTLLSTVVGNPFYLSPDCAGLQPGSRRQRALSGLISGGQVAVTNGDHVLACYGTCVSDDAVCRSTDSSALLRCQIYTTMTAQPWTIRWIVEAHYLRGGLIFRERFKRPQPAPAAGCGCWGNLTVLRRGCSRRQGRRRLSRDGCCRPCSRQDQRQRQHQQCPRKPRGPTAGRHDGHPAGNAPSALVLMVTRTGHSRTFIPSSWIPGLGLHHHDGLDAETSGIEQGHVVEHAVVHSTSVKKPKDNYPCKNAKFGGK